MIVTFRKFYSAYRTLHINYNNGRGKLRRCCDNAKCCWLPNSDERLIIVRGQGYITYPYIGKNYRTGGMVVIAINHRDNHGYFNKLEGSLITSKDHRYVCSEINKHDDDKVWYFYNHVAKYVEALMFGNVIGDEDEWDSYKEVFHKIALVQAIKCNPRGSNRPQEQPTTKMWNNCPQHILYKELEILKPGNILVLGKTNHPKVLQSLTKLKYYQIGKPIKRRSVFRYSYFKKPDKTITVYVANHPSHTGGKSIQSICKDLVQIRLEYPKFPPCLNM